ncbi:hypothetical protein Q9189_007371 [Teloschistes chrysophthalmus]
MDEDRPDGTHTGAKTGLINEVEPTQKKLQLMDLSPKLFVCILDYVRSSLFDRPTLLTQVKLEWRGWMHSLLLVCKKLYDLTLPRLYRELDWSMDTTQEGNRAASYHMLHMLNPDNPGLKYVRELSLYDAHETSRSPDDMFEYPDAAMLVHLLPKNILTNFDEMVQSCSRSLLDALNKVERFQVMPGPNEPLPQVAWDFFRSHPETRYLYFDFSHMPRGKDDNEKDPLRTSSGALQAFFKSFDTSSAVLNSLDLTGVDLRGSHGNVMAAIDLKTLSDLHLYSCNDTDDFLAALNEGSAGYPLRLKSFTLYHARRWHPPNPTTGDALSNRLLVKVTRST